MKQGYPPLKPDSLFALGGVCTAIHDRLKDKYCGILYCGLSVQKPK
jgi:hypothetical protein